MTSIDLFAGAGGASLGLRRAGFGHIACVDRDEHACETLRAAGFPVLRADVRALPIRAELAPTLLWASPPCQAWSSAGKRLGATDDRNLWPATIAAIDHLRPAWFLAENVVGMMHHVGTCDRCGPTDDCRGCYFERWVLPEVRRRFTWSEVRVLNASGYGVPQHRHRVFVAAGPWAIRWPEATHDDPAALHQGSLFGAARRPWVTVRQALDLDGTVRAPAPGRSALAQSCRPLDPDRPADAVQAGSPTSNHAPVIMVVGLAGEAWRLDQPAPAVTAREVKGARHQRFDPNRTPMSASDMAWRAMGFRRLSPDQCALLQAFPADWPWRGNKVCRYAQIGNAVPPLVAEMLGRAVMDAAACG